MTPRGRGYGAIDIGSLTVRLGVVRLQGRERSWRWLCRREQVTGLGAFTADGRLTAGARCRTLQALALFLKIGRSLGITRLTAAATQAVRQAVDGPAFLEQLRSRTGLAVRLLSPTEEAALTWRGIRATLPPALVGEGPLLAFDLGGGSLEIIWHKGDGPPCGWSLAVSPLALLQEWQAGDPPTPEELARLQRRIRDELQPVRFWSKSKPPPVLVLGSGGAVNTLRALADQQGPRPPGPRGLKNLNREELEALLRQLASQPLAQRARLPQLGPLKAAPILPATLVVLELLDLWPGNPLTVTPAGLLEGLIADLLDLEQTGELAGAQIIPP